MIFILMIVSTASKQTMLFQALLLSMVLAIPLTLSENTEVLLLHENGFCYNNLIASQKGVGRRYCTTMYAQLHATQGDAVLYHGDSR